MQITPKSIHLITTVYNLAKEFTTVVKSENSHCKLSDLGKDNVPSIIIHSAVSLNKEPPRNSIRPFILFTLRGTLLFHQFLLGHWQESLQLLLLELLHLLLVQFLVSPKRSQHPLVHGLITLVALVCREVTHSHGHECEDQATQD